MVNLYQALWSIFTNLTGASDMNAASIVLTYFAFYPLVFMLLYFFIVRDRKKEDNESVKGGLTIGKYVTNNSGKTFVGLWFGLPFGIFFLLLDYARLSKLEESQKK